MSSMSDSSKRRKELEEKTLKDRKWLLEQERKTREASVEIGRANNLDVSRDLARVARIDEELNQIAAELKRLTT